LAAALNCGIFSRLGNRQRIIMKQLLTTHSLSYVQGLQVALEADGIQSVILDEQSLGYLGFAGRIRLAVADDDHERALEIVRELEASPAPTEVPASWRLQRWGCAAALSGFALVLVGVVASDSDLRWPALILTIAGGCALLAGLAVVALGRFRDREDSAG
jgi:hypothetical protein